MTGSEPPRPNVRDIKYCPGCGTALPPEAMLCDKCGTAQPEPLPVTNKEPTAPDVKYCPSCGVVLPADANVCDKCKAVQPAGVRVSTISARRGWYRGVGLAMLAAGAGGAVLEANNNGICNSGVGELAQAVSQGVLSSCSQISLVFYGGIAVSAIGAVLFIASLVSTDGRNV